MNRLGSEMDEVVEPVYRDTRCLVSVSPADADFIANARTDIPLLLDALELLLALAGHDDWTLPEMPSRRFPSMDRRATQDALAEALKPLGLEW